MPFFALSILFYLRFILGCLERRSMPPNLFNTRPYKFQAKQSNWLFAWVFSSCFIWFIHSYCIPFFFNPEERTFTSTHTHTRISVRLVIDKYVQVYLIWTTNIFNDVVIGCLSYSCQWIILFDLIAIAMVPRITTFLFLLLFDCSDRHSNAEKLFCKSITLIHAIADKKYLYVSMCALWLASCFCKMIFSVWTMPLMR